MWAEREGRLMPKSSEIPSEEELYKLNHATIMGVEAEIHFESVRSGIYKAVESQAKPTLHKISDFFKRKDYYKELKSERSPRPVKEADVAANSEPDFAFVQRMAAKRRRLYYCI